MAYGKASDDTGGQNRFVVAGITGASAVFATRNGGIPDLAITIPGGRTLDQATNDDFRAHYIGIQGQNISDRTQGTKLDATYDVDNGLFRSITFGGSWTDRKKTVETIDNQYTTSCNYCGYPFTFGQLGASVVRPGSKGTSCRNCPAISRAISPISISTPIWRPCPAPTTTRRSSIPTAAWTIPARRSQAARYRPIRRIFGPVGHPRSSGILSDQGADLGRICPVQPGRRALAGRYRRAPGIDQGFLDRIRCQHREHHPTRRDAGQ